MSETQTIGTIANKFLRPFEEANSRPRIPCSRCKKLNCLDFGAGARVVICEDCEKIIELEKKSEQKKHELQQRIKNSGLPERWHKCAWDTFKELTPLDTQAKKIAMDSWHRDKGLTLIGPAGVGKTHLLACINLAFCRKGIQPVFIKARDLISEITESWKSKTPYNPVEKIAGYSVVILEDLTFESPPPEFVQRNLNQLMDKIYEQEKIKLFVSTNLPLSGVKSLESFLSVSGQRSPFVSRLCELTEIIKWPDNFPDRRLQKK